jgi:hypothetical protein
MSDTITPSSTVAAPTTAGRIDEYLAAYGEPDAARRRQLIVAAFTEDATLVDPPEQLAGRGHGGLDAVFAAVQQQFPGHTFRRTTAVDEHHDVARYGWELVAPDGSVTVAGTDFVGVAEDGRLRSVAGFFGSAPASLGA